MHRIDVAVNSFITRKALQEAVGVRDASVLTTMTYCALVAASSTATDNRRRSVEAKTADALWAVIGCGTCQLQRYSVCVCGRVVQLGIYLEYDGLAFRLRCLAENIVHNLEIFVTRQCGCIVLIKVIDEIVQQKVGACNGREKQQQQSEYMSVT